MQFGWRTMLPLFVFLLSILGIFFVYQSKAFTVRHFICATNHGDCPDYVQAELNSHIGQSLFFTDFTLYGDQITRLAPFLTRFELTKQFPDTVKMTFFSAEPVYRFAESGGRTWLVDTAGYVIGVPNSSQASYPLVVAQPAVKFRPDFHERVEPELHQSIENAIQAIKQEHLGETQFYLLNDQEGYIQLPDGKLAYFRLSAASEQLAKLSYLLKHFTFSTVKEPIAEIDLRYSQVILRNQRSAASASATVKQ